MADEAYAIETAKPEDKEDIDNFVHNNFFKDMPLFRIFGIEEVPHNKTNDSEMDKITAFVVKAVSRNGDIIGVAINRNNKTVPPITEGVDKRFIQLVEFTKYVDKVAGISNLPERTVELRILSVASSWRKRGIAKQLAQESIRLGKEQGFEVMKVCCTSEFTAKLVRSLGFQEIYKMAYSDYRIITGKDVVMEICPPHFYIYYYVMYLQKENR